MYIKVYSKCRNCGVINEARKIYFEDYSLEQIIDNIMIDLNKHPLGCHRCSETEYGITELKFLTKEKD